MWEQLRHNFTITSAYIQLATAHSRGPKISVRRAETCCPPRCPDRENGISKHPATIHQFGHQINILLFLCILHCHFFIIPTTQTPSNYWSHLTVTISTVCCSLHQVQILFRNPRKLSTQGKLLPLVSSIWWVSNTWYDTVKVPKKIIIHIDFYTPQNRIFQEGTWNKTVWGIKLKIQ